MSKAEIKRLLNEFFKSDMFFLGVIRHTRAVLDSAGTHNWWSVDVYKQGDQDAWELVYRATVTYRPKGWYTSLQMISEADLAQLEAEAGSEDEQALAEALKKHPEMLTDVKRLMREQLP